jgi:hypothetical protein
MQNFSQTPGNCTSSYFNGGLTLANLYDALNSAKTNNTSLIINVGKDTSIQNTLYFNAVGNCIQWTPWDIKKDPTMKLSFAQPYTAIELYNNLVNPWVYMLRKGIVMIDAKGVQQFNPTVVPQMGVFVNDSIRNASVHFAVGVSGIVIGGIIVYLWMKYKK